MIIPGQALDHVSDEQQTVVALLLRTLTVAVAPIGVAAIQAE